MSSDTVVRSVMELWRRVPYGVQPRLKTSLISQFSTSVVRSFRVLFGGTAVICELVFV